MEHTFSVAEFGQLMSDLLDQTFPHDVWVQGEVRGIRRAQSGHVYFDLVDSSPEPGRAPEALLAVVLFKGTRKTVNIQIKSSGGGMRIDDGVAVRIRAVPNFYAPQGKFSLRMTGIDPAYTLGQMVAAREVLLQKLNEEGLLEHNGRLSFPLVPLRIGLVTAESSAAQADFIEELRSAELGFQLLLANTPVQGIGVAARIAAAISACERHNVDVIAVVRGGGAKTDLVAFDDEVLARCIAACSVPIITGIGHEIDTSVADHVAHQPFKTPTACAAHLVATVLSAERAAESTWTNIATRAVQHLQSHDRAVTAAASTTRDRAGVLLRGADTRLNAHITTAIVQVRHLLRGSTDQCDRAAEQLRRASQQRLSNADGVLRNAEDRARLLDPARAVARGWSITTTASGALVRSVDDIAIGAQLTTRVADGRIVSVVERTSAPGAGED